MFKQRTQLVVSGLLRAMLTAYDWGAGNVLPAPNAGLDIDGFTSQCD